MRILMLGFNLVVLSLFYLVWQNREKHAKELKTWLKDNGHGALADILNMHGIWFKQGFTSSNPEAMFHLVVESEKFKYQFIQAKDKLKEELMMDMWLKYKKLGIYLKFKDANIPGSFRVIGYWYPGEIFNLINDLPNIDIQERYALRTDVHKFKAAVREFVSGQSSTILDKRKEFEQKLSQPPTVMTFIDPEAYEQILSHSKLTTAYMFAYALIGHIIISLGVPKANPGTSNTILAFIFFWFCPDLGKFVFLMILFHRLFKDAVKTVVYAGLVHIWMTATTSLMIHIYFNSSELYYIMFSVLPTFVIYVFYKALKFQPHVIKDKESGNLDVTLGGMGCINKNLAKFLQRKSINFIYRFILASSIAKKFEWDEVTRLRTEETDVEWDILKQAIMPAARNEKLNTLWIMNNRLFDDKAAQDLANFLKDYKTLEVLRICFDYNFKLWENICYFLFWDNIPVKLTTKGVKTIVQALIENKDCKIKCLDFYGTDLSKDCLKLCRELFEKGKINMRGSKEQKVVRSLFDRFFQYKIIKLMCVLVVATYIAYMVQTLIIRGI